MSWEAPSNRRTRAERGERTEHRDTHYDPCDGTGCPCLIEGAAAERAVWVARIESARDEHRTGMEATAFAAESGNTFHRHVGALDALEGLLAPAEKEQTEPVVDLMDALMRSVEQAKADRRAAEKEQTP